jgi:hypothetical protein
MVPATLISIVALVISLITFSLQFIAHDRLAYLLSNVTTVFWPNNVYLIVSLSVFNSGNRPVALISATADLVEMKIEHRQEVTDADCVTSPTSKVRELFAAQPGNDSPVNAAVYQYGAAIDGGKLITANLVFRRFGDDAPRNETVEGLACLRLAFADATETRYFVSRPLTGVFVAFPDQSTQKTIPASRSSVPSLVVDKQRFELPF